MGRQGAGGAVGVAKDVDEALRTLYAPPSGATIFSCIQSKPKRADRVARTDKLLAKLANPGASMTWAELATLMRHHGFELVASKRGSGRKFYQRDKDLLVCLHEPHPSPILKPYMKAEAIEALKQTGVEL